MLLSRRPYRNELQSQCRTSTGQPHYSQSILAVTKDIGCGWTHTHTHGCKAKTLWALYLHICSLTHWTLKPRQWGCFNKSRNVSHEVSVAHPAGGFHLISLRPAMSCTHNWSLTHNRPSSFVDHSLGVNQDTDGHDFPDLTCFCKAEHPPIILL